MLEINQGLKHNPVKPDLTAEPFRLAGFNTARMQQAGRQDKQLKPMISRTAVLSKKRFSAGL
jgi:hypothetical protein